jgi:hypothetical protein
LSRATFASSLARHHFPFAFGADPCWGQSCQKQPSTKTTIRWRGKTTSGLQRRPLMGAMCFLNRRPDRCNIDRSSFSVALSDRFPSMTLRAFSEDAGGAGGTLGTSPISIRGWLIHIGAGTGGYQRCSAPNESRSRGFSQSKVGNGSPRSMRFSRSRTSRAVSTGTRTLNASSVVRT